MANVYRHNKHPSMFSHSFTQVSSEIWFLVWDIISIFSSCKNLSILTQTRHFVLSLQVCSCLLSVPRFTFIPQKFNYCHKTEPKGKFYTDAMSFFTFKTNITLTNVAYFSHDLYSNIQLQHPKCSGANVASLPQVWVFTMLLLIARNAKYYVSSTGTIFVQILMDIVHLLKMLDCEDTHARTNKHTHRTAIT